MTFDEYVAQRLGGLLRFAMVITCDGHLAEDVVQDVLVRAHGRWRRITVMEHPEAYLRRMIVNEYLSWRRRSRRLQAVPDHGLYHGENDALIRRVAELPPDQRTVIGLRFFGDGRDAAIADSHLPQALEQIAARAPDPSAPQARLASRIRAHRQRRAVLATAAALGTGAAVGIPTALALRRPTLPYSTAAQAPLGLRPTWVPDELVAYSREASVHGLNSEQEWRIPQDGEQFPTGISRSTRLSFSMRWISPRASDRPSKFPLLDKPNTTVGGRPAQSGSSMLKWLVADDVLATVTASARDDVDLHRVAESMVDDQHAVCEVAMHTGWLPTVIHEGQEMDLKQRMRVRGTAQGWVQEVAYADWLITIRLASASSVFDEPYLRQPFEAVTVRGRPGRIRYLRGGSGVEEQVEILFDLPDGRFSQVKCYFPFDDPAELRANTIRIAEDLSIGPNPDLHWLGRPLP